MRNAVNNKTCQDGLNISKYDINGIGEAESNEMKLGLRTAVSSFILQDLYDQRHPPSDCLYSDSLFFRKRVCRIKNLISGIVNGSLNGTFKTNKNIDA